MEQHHITSPMDRCIAECLYCYRMCRHAAMNHCLEVGGEHVDPQHFRLMASCAEICRATADVMLSGTALHDAICTACAGMCDACADSCQRLEGMEDCVQACRACARSCRDMSVTGGVHPRSAGTGAEHRTLM